MTLYNPPDIFWILLERYYGPEFYLIIFLYMPCSMGIHSSPDLLLSTVKAKNKLAISGIKGLPLQFQFTHKEFIFNGS